MFDTVNFWIDRCNISGEKPFEILHYLDKAETPHKDMDGRMTAKGIIGNYTVYVSEYGISLYGSLAKYYLGNNMETLTRETAKMAIEQLFSNLHLDKNTAQVTRLDVAAVIPTQHIPASYYSYLGQKPHFERVQYNSDTLYYNNHQKQIIFYDKAKEAKAGNVSIPEIFINNNLFRYELRYTNRLNTQFKTYVTATTITNEVFYRKITQNWHNEFKTIKKLKNLSFMIDNITTPKKAKDVLFASLLQKEKQSFIEDFLNKVKAKKRLNRQRQYELRQNLYSIVETPIIEQTNDLMQELEKKIFTTAKYAT